MAFNLVTWSFQYGDKTEQVTLEAPPSAADLIGALRRKFNDNNIAALLIGDRDVDITDPLVQKLAPNSTYTVFKAVSGPPLVQPSAYDVSDTSHTPSQVANAGVAWEALHLKPLSPDALFPGAWPAVGTEFPVPKIQGPDITEDAVQRAWAEAAQAWSAKSPMVLLLDCQNVESLPRTALQNALKPDLVGYHRADLLKKVFSGSQEVEFQECTTKPPGLLGAFSIDLVGEVTAPGNFTDDKCGQVLVYAQSMLYAQPTRSHLYAFLANDTHIKFFYFEREPQTDNVGVVKTSHSLTLADGVGYLAILLSQSRRELGQTAPSRFEVPNFGVLTIGAHLGSGRSSVVYAATADSKAGEYVVKCFQMTQEEQFKNERDHLLHLQHLAVSGRFPSLLGVAPREYGRILVLTPRALPLPSTKRSAQNFLTGSQVVDLFNVLAVMHKEGQVVHRDLSPGNVYHHPTDPKRVMVADFGFAVRAGTLAQIAGTLRYAADEVLVKWSGAIKWLPRFDVESAVKLCYVQSRELSLSYLPPATATHSDLLTWWRDLAARKESLQAALEAARSPFLLEPHLYLQAYYTKVAELVTKFWTV